MHIDRLPRLPPRPDDAHKGTFGTLLVVGGSTQMIGAPMLAARSAYRAGCGLVQVAMPQSVLAPALAIVPEAIALGLEGGDSDAQKLRGALEKADAVVAGPGLGQEPAAEALLGVILEGDLPVVLDADALNMLATRDKWPTFNARAILTPHPGEMRRLMRHVAGERDEETERRRDGEVPDDEPGRIELARAAARALGAVMVLKGRHTVVSDGERHRVNRTGGVALAKAGTGDVLSGLIGSLLAQGMEPLDAAICGVHYHGLAGELAARELTARGTLATDVADRVARAIEPGGWE